MRKARIIILSILTASLISGCRATSQQPKVDLDLVRNELSWAAFCATYGYPLDCITHEAVNRYLDTWRGSVPEEEVLAKAGLEL